MASGKKRMATVIGSGDQDRSLRYGLSRDTLLIVTRLRRVSFVSADPPHYARPTDNEA